jgi:hypothetical protein
MLRFFRLNDPYRLLGLLFILIMISLPLFIHPGKPTVQEVKDLVVGHGLSGKTLYNQLIVDMAPLAAWFSNGVFVLFGKSIMARHLIALLFIFFQASFFSALLINNKAYNESNYLPSLILGLLAFYSFDLLSLSPELISSTVLLFALNNLFKEIEFKVQRDEIILNLGLYLGIASLIIFSYSVFLLGTLIILVLFTRITIRRSFLLIFGFILPHLALFSFYFFWDNQSNLYQYFYLPNFTMEGLRLVGLKSIFILGLLPVFYFLLSLFMLNREAHFTKYQSQLLQVMFFWLITAVCQVIITRELTPHSFFPFLPPLAYFISHYLLLVRRKRIAEIMLWAFMGGLITMNWASRSGKIGWIDYSKMISKESKYGAIIKDRKIMVLEDDLEIYNHNKVATYFLDWSLSKRIFEEPDYFEHVALIDRSISNNMPDIIIDKDDLMKPLLERIPRLKLLYRREGDFYVRINN